eukprot:Seg6632.1 transcript_id=Seg6632.1/GoldUCD/mRNA.D3Y31 product="Protein ABHD1" protein_id=Seg6632.1/GoldUCD/D3Y31
MSLVTLLLELSPLCAILYFYLFWNQRKTSRPPYVSFKKSLFNSLAVQYCQEMLCRPYVPTIWAFSPRLHTAYFTKWPKSSIDTKTEYLEVSNGKIIGISWPNLEQDANNNLRDSSPIVIVLCNPLQNDNSIQPFLEVAVKNGFRLSVFLHRESTSIPKLPTCEENTVLQSDIPYEETEDYSDFCEAVLYMSSKYPNSSLYAISISYGSPTLFKFLTTDARAKILKGAASISPAWHKQKYNYSLQAAVESEPSRSRGRLVHSQSVDSLLSKITRRECYVSRRIPGAHRSTTLSTEAFGRFKRLSVPMMIVYSKDDPVYSSEDRSRLSGVWKNSDVLVVVETNKGGHAGFLQGFKPESWAAVLVFQYFEAVEKFKDATIC